MAHLKGRTLCINMVGYLGLGSVTIASVVF